MIGNGEASFNVPDTLIKILSPGFAAEIAARKEPGPPSSRVITLNVPARAGIATRMRQSTDLKRDLTSSERIIIGIERA
jgi:hypothetical protein